MSPPLNLAKFIKLLPGDVPGHLGLTPTLGGHSQRINSQLSASSRLALTGDGAQDHQVLRDDVKGNNDRLTD